MPQFGGGHEDFSAEEAQLRALREEREALIAAERVSRGETLETAKVEEDTQRKRVQARREQTAVVRRAASVQDVEVQKVNQDTESIERNTRARKASTEAARRQAVNLNRALTGAQDPMFGRAYGIAGRQTTQYAMRQQLEGVGSRRARAMQEAMISGYRPSEGPGEGGGPLTRSRAATLALEQSEARLAEANRELTNTRRRASATDAERLAAADAQANARRTRDSARTELASADARAAAARELTAAEHALAAKLRAEAAQRQVGRQLDLFGGDSPYERTPVGTGGGGAPPPPPVRPGQMGFFDDDDAQRAASGLNATAAATNAASGAAAGYANNLDELARQQIRAREARVAQYTDTDAKALQRLGVTARNAGVEFYPLSQQMHRHGALTSEFIAAAARGETTLREMGNQALLTAGKFAGWTVAASGVYGAAAAFQRVGEGAIQASSGVDQALRVINQGVDKDALQGDFGDLATRFNVPIEQAADAVYRMGQVFHDQGDAVKAAEAALYSYKTGEVDIGVSTKNLIAIQQGFQLSSGELVSIFDQINAAQNKFGISIGDTEAGLAKASGTYRNAGGDLDYLLGLFVAIQKSTGRSGTEIGTGISRAVQRIREPIAQAKLSAQGIEVDPGDFQKTLQNALKRAAKGGVDLQEISTGLFGNQYARLITGVLADQDLLNEALGDTSPEAAKGSAEQELQRVLSETREQLAAVGIALESLGNELSRAGVFNVFGALLVGGTKMLQLAGDIVDVFNRLPEPFREVLVYLAEALVLLKAAQRLGATDALAGGALGFLAKPDQRLKTAAVAGLRTSRQEAFNESERAGREVYRTASEADRRRLEAARYAQTPEFRSARGLPEESEERQRVMIRRETLEAEARTAEQQHIRAVQTRNRELEVANRVDRDLNDAKKTQSRNIRKFLISRDIPVARNLDQPNLAGTFDVDRVGGAVTPGAIGAERQAQAASQRARQTSAAAGRVNRALGNAFTELRVAGATLSTGGGGYAMRRIGDGAIRTANGLERGTQAIASARTGLAKIPGEARGFVSGLGALDAALLGLIAIQGLDMAADYLSRQINEVDDALQNYRGNSQKAQKNLRKQTASIREGPTHTVGSFGADLTQFFADIATTRAARDVYSGRGYENPWEKRERVRAEAIQLTDEQRHRQELQDEARRQGRARPQLTAGQLISDVAETEQQRKLGLISLREFDKQMELYGIELKTLLDPTKRQSAAAAAAIAGAARGGQGLSYAQALQGLNPKQLAAEAEAIRTATAAFGGADEGIRNLADVYREQVAQLAGHSDAASMVVLGQARSAYYDGVNTMIQADLQSDLASAGGDEGARRAAFAQAASRLKSERNRALANRNAVALNAQQAQKRARAARQAVEEYEPGATSDLLGRPVIGGFGAQIEGGRAGLVEDLKAAQKEAADLKGRSKTANDELKAARRALEALDRELASAGFEDRAAGRNIRLQLQLSRTADPGQQAAIQLRFARQGVNDAAETFGRNSREYRQALTELNQARMAQAQAVLANVQADNAILMARASGDPATAAQAATQAALNELNAMRQANAKRPGTFSQNQIKQQQANVISTGIQQREQARQEQIQVDSLLSQIEQARKGGDPVAAARAAVAAAKRARASASGRVERLQALLDLINANNDLEDALIDRANARFDLLASQTDDPLKQAKIERRRAARNLKGTKGTERIRALAEYNRADRAVKTTAIEGAVDDINFNLEMGKISADVAAKQLEALAKTKDISKAKKRELLLAAKRLRDEAQGDYELELGDIKLPTLYEVRRFVQGGYPGGEGTVHNNQQITVNVNRTQDIGGVAAVLESTNGGAGKAAARAMNLR